MLEPFARDRLTITLQLSGDWTGWTFSGDIRAQRDHTSTLIASFAEFTGTVKASGLIVVSIAPAVMQAVVPDVDYWFDIKAVSGSERYTIVQDQIRLTTNVTP